MPAANNCALIRLIDIFTINYANRELSLKTKRAVK